jgi:hypothetical protein
MVSSRRWLLFSAALLLMFLAGCGGSSSNPTPQGGFNNSSLNGTFAISFSGSNANGFFAVAGTLTFDGSGHITAGVIDENRAPSPLTNLNVTGTYNVHADGRGVLGLVTPQGNMNLVFVIVAGNRALVTRFEQSATASGSMDLVNSGAFSTAALAGTFVFNLSGLGASGNSGATVGSITTDTAGSITSGVQDLSDNGVISSNQPISGGTVQVAGNGRGTATINTAAGAANFAFYVVDANRLKLVEIDSLPAFAGDAFRQTGAISNASFNGALAFTVSGNDTAFGPFAAGGVLTSNGAGAVTSGTEDVNDGGVLTTNVAISGTYSLAANGRGTATIAVGTTTTTFAIYPTTNGVQMLETDPGLAVSGAAFQQSTGLTSATINGNYGLNMTAATVGGELDSVASLAANGSGHITGITDINNVGSTSTGTSLTASYSVDATGRGPFTVQTGIGQQNMAIYVISSSRALFIELDNNIVAVGAIEHQ